MDRKLGRLIVIAGMTLTTFSVFAQQAPFCVVSNGGLTSCFYYTIDACRQAASSLGGMCAANIAQQQQMPIQPQPAQGLQQRQLNIADSFNRGVEAGQMRRMREEQIKLLQAQREAYSVPTAPTSSTYTVTYECTADDGTKWLSESPYLGCIVVNMK